MAAPKFLRLGASLYVPASHPKLLDIVNGHKLKALRSLIICTEDAVRAEDLERALENLAEVLHRIEPSDTLRYVRVRNEEVLSKTLGMSGVKHLDGFVLPKVTVESLEACFELLPAQSSQDVMLTLETVEVFDAARMSAFARILLQERFQRRVLSLRIGGNDLLSMLGIRRPRASTIYDTPVGKTISDLVTIFRPLGFNLTAPLYDGIDDDGTLEREVVLDLAHGLLGKTAIHPRQVSRIEALYRVARDDLKVAEGVLDRAAPAVFNVDGRMCEPATQLRWAEITVARAQLFGLS